MSTDDQTPIKPKLHPLTVEVLSKLGETNETEFVIGGGVALCHYVEPRETYDLDGWWREQESPETLEKLKEILSAIAEREKLKIQTRNFNDVISLELHDPNGKKVYSVQVAHRDVYLDVPTKSPWNVPIETLKDNVGSKMKALINRGTPRDFLDIYKLCSEKKTNPTECWDLAAQVHQGGIPAGTTPDQLIDQGKIRVRTHLEILERRRPLPPFKPEETTEISNARALRKWFKEQFIQKPGDKSKPADPQDPPI